MAALPKGGAGGGLRRGAALSDAAPSRPPTRKAASRSVAGLGDPGVRFAVRWARQAEITGSVTDGQFDRPNAALLAYRSRHRPPPHLRTEAIGLLQLPAVAVARPLQADAGLGSPDPQPTRRGQEAGSRRFVSPVEGVFRRKRHRQVVEWPCEDEGCHLLPLGRNEIAGSGRHAVAPTFVTEYRQGY